METATQYLTYKGKPLVRCGNILYYGTTADKYIIKLEIKQTEMIGDLEVAKQVIIQLLDNNPNLRSKKKIVKSGEREGLYAALDIAEAWLARNN